MVIPEETIRAFCKKWQIRSFCFYGSIMRDDFRPDSDIDVMIEFSPDDRTSSLNMSVGLQEDEALFSRKVDLVERRSIEQSENYIRRKGILSGNLPSSARCPTFSICSSLHETPGRSPGTRLLKCPTGTRCSSTRSPITAGGWPSPHTGRCPDPPEIPGYSLGPPHENPRLFETDFCRPDRELIKEIAWDVVPAIIPVLNAIIPPEDMRSYR